MPQRSVITEKKLFKLLPEKANEWEFPANVGCLKPHTEQVNQLVFSWNKLSLLQSDFSFPISHDNERKNFFTTQSLIKASFFIHSYFGDRTLLYRN